MAKSVNFKDIKEDHLFLLEDDESDLALYRKSGLEGLLYDRDAGVSRGLLGLYPSASRVFAPDQQVYRLACEKD